MSYLSEMNGLSEMTSHPQLRLDRFLLYGIQQSRDGIAFIDMNGKIRFVNDAWIDLHGYTRAELLGQPASMFYTEKARAETWDYVVAHLRQQSFFEMELDHLKKNNTQFRAWLTVSLLWEADEPVGYVVTVRDISEWRQLQQSLEAEKHHLQQLYTQLQIANLRLQEQATDLAARNADLDAFAHSVAHDLKNLLTSVIGYAELLTDEFDNLAVVDRKRFLQQILGSGSKMRHIIDDLLLMARLRKEEVVLTPIAMGEIIHEAMARVTSMTQHHQPAFTLAQEWPVVLGHPSWVEEVWVNYLSNALKYGGDPPQIAIGFTPIERGWVRFWVQDNGPGIDPADQGRLFAPFVRLAKSRSEGHGLGLSIVQRIVEKCGGTVGVESIVGNGCTFWFTLACIDGHGLS